MKRGVAVLMAVAGVVTAAFALPYRRGAVAKEPGGAVAAVPAASGGGVERAGSGPEILVYKSPTCGCCKKWNEYLTANGFVVTTRDLDDVSPIKAELGVPRKLVSCHTAVVQGYVIEGHVPAADIARLLKEKPKVLGLSAPGMPGASPGMDAGSDPYDVVTFDAQGATTVWARH